jgi:hypothetical protein
VNIAISGDSGYLPRYLSGGSDSFSLGGDTRVLGIDTDIQNFCDLSLIKITEIMSISQK